ncbi:MAG: ABC transporter permease [Candidatus Tectomicrobia bacterium]|nr:ABC transporter permease [Candidatus Tectomicrobia bacterium]
MRTYILKRLLQLIPTLVIISLFVFMAMRLLPGDPLIGLLGDAYEEENARLLRQEYGLDQPLLVQYGVWLGHLVRGDWGQSILNGRPVLPDILWYLPVSIELILAALFVSVSIALPAGIIAAVRRNTWIDYSATTTALIGVSAPDFFFGVLMLLLFTIVLNWLPSSGWMPWSQSVWGHGSRLLMPAITLGFSQAAILTRMLRGTLLEVIRMEYITTARAKGLSGWWVIIKHALKNALIPVVTILGLQLGFLIGGAVVVETLFAILGLGSYGMQAILSRDYPQVQGFILFVALAFTVSNVAVDLLYAVLDPRIRYEDKR